MNPPAGSEGIEGQSPGEWGAADPSAVQPGADPSATPRWSDEYRCTATVRRTGQRCRGPRVSGARVCRMHGGAAKQVRRAAARRELDRDVRQALARRDVEPVDDPLREQARQAGQVLAWRDELAARVNALTSLRYSAGESGTEQLRAEVALFERALDRCAHVLGLMARLGIDERVTRVSERQVDMVVRVVNAAIAAVGADPAAATAARHAAARELRLISGGST